ncbi:MAG: amino acid transporter permease [Chloroflexi bacterium]|nr:amino acid transporter permease [Chloroflexota bacterium]
MISSHKAAEQHKAGVNHSRGSAPSRAGNAQARRTALWRRLPWASLLLLLPATALLLIFLFGPIVQAIRVATTNEALTGPQAINYGFVGLANFSQLLTDPDFHNALGVSAKYVISSVIGITALGLLLAYLMRRGVHPLLVKLVSAIVIIAWVIPEIVAGFIWLAFGGSNGTLAMILSPVSAGESDWLIRAPLVLVTVATIWATTAFSMLVFTAGLHGLPEEVLEAATVDGANLWQRIVRIELPMLKSTIATNLILVTLTVLTDFTLIYTLTAGGPGTATTTLPLYVFQEAISFTVLGYGTAAAVVLVAVAAFVSMLYVLLLKIEV